MKFGNRAERVLRFLLGLRNPRVSSAMAAHGFTEADLREGWTLVQGLGGTKLSVVPIQPKETDTIEQLDQWENRWFPIANASLARRFPAVHARLFLNLSQTEGPGVAISVQTMLDRLNAMADANGPYGAEGPKALELLQARGLTAGVIEQASALLANLGKVAPAEPISIEERQAELAKAEEDLWAWYLEWSQVARIAVKQRVLLRQMGFLANGRAEAEPEEDEPAPEPPPVSAPAAATP